MPGHASPRAATISGPDLRQPQPEGRRSPISLDFVDDHSRQDSKVAVHLDVDVLEDLAPPDQRVADVAGYVALPIKDLARVGRPTKARRMQVTKGLLIRRGECLGALECRLEDCVLVDVHQPSLACTPGSCYAARRRCRSGTFARRPEGQVEAPTLRPLRSVGASGVGGRGHPGRTKSRRWALLRRASGDAVLVTRCPRHSGARHGARSIPSASLTASSMVRKL